MAQTIPGGKYLGANKMLHDANGKTIEDVPAAGLPEKQVQEDIAPEPEKTKTKTKPEKA
jgi:hypothetical protein